jgi:hypothetical protein
VNVPRRSCWPLTQKVELFSISTGLWSTFFVMSLPPRNPWENPRNEEEESWWDLLGAVFEPLSEVAVYAAICIIGGGLIVASRRTPFIPLAIGVVAVIVSVYVASRHAARAGHRWRLATYLAFTALAIGALAVGAGFLYLVWAMTCDC